MKGEYVKSYKEKELRLFILSYLLVSVTSILIYTLGKFGSIGLVLTLMEMLTCDLFAGIACTLVGIFSELLPDDSKNRLVYGSLPSDTIFSDLASERVTIPGVVNEAVKMHYKSLCKASPEKQTSEWNRMLYRYRDMEMGSILEAQRQQLYTRDCCVSSMLLGIANLFSIVMAALFLRSIVDACMIFSFPLIYITLMFVVTRVVAQKRACKLVCLVIKADVIDRVNNSPKLES